MGQQLQQPCQQKVILDLVIERLESMAVRLGELARRVHHLQLLPFGLREDLQQHRLLYVLDMLENYQGGVALLGQLRSIKELDQEFEMACMARKLVFGQKIENFGQKSKI